MMTHALLNLIALGVFVLPAAIVGSKPQGTPVTVTPLSPKPCPTCQRSSFMTNSALKEPMQLVIRNAKEWQEAWERVHCKVISPVPPLPEVDFGKDMLVLAALGTRSSGGHGIIVENAVAIDDRLEITVRKESPGKNCFTTQALTQPVDIVKLPKSDRRVVFKEKDFVHDCK